MGTKHLGVVKSWMLKADNSVRKNEREQKDNQNALSGPAADGTIQTCHILFLPCHYYHRQSVFSLEKTFYRVS